MDAKTIRLRLSGHGDVTAHQDGSFTLGLTRLWGESWGYRLKKAVMDEVPGARIRVVRCRRLSDRMFERHEVVFRVGPEPVSRVVSGLLAANGALLAAVAGAQASLGDGLADGVMTPREAISVAAALSETRARIEVFLAGLGAER